MNLLLLKYLIFIKIVFEYSLKYNFNQLYRIQCKTKNKIAENTYLIKIRLLLHK